MLLFSCAVGWYIDDCTDSHRIGKWGRIPARRKRLVVIPEVGAVVPEFDDPQIREVFEKSYRLIYHVGDETVSVLGLIHGARDLAAMWDSDERQP